MTARIVHVLGLCPHVAEHLVDVTLEHAEALRGNGTAHQRERVHGKERIELKVLDAVLLDEALRFELLVGKLVADAGVALHRRAVVRQLEHAAEQDRHILELRAGALLDARDDRRGSDRHSGCRSRNETRRASPLLRERTDLVLEGPRVARLLIQRPIGFGDGFRPHQLIGLEVRERFLASCGLDPLAHERRVDACIDNQVRDVNVPSDRARERRFVLRRAVRTWRSRMRSSRRHLGDSPSRR